MGCSHSGSTILSIMFNNSKNTINVSELLSHINYIPNWMSETSKNSCTCGKRFKDCEFWTAVTGKTISKLGGTELWDRFISLAAQFNASGKMLAALLPSASDSEDKNRYLSNVQDFYDVIAEHSGSDLIVDSSKSIDHALLMRLNFTNIYLLHLVRNGEDFVASLLYRLAQDRPRAFQSDIFKISFMKPVYVLLVSFWWLLQNLVCEMIRLTGRQRVLQIRYEDLCENPERELQKISAFVGKDLSDMVDRVTHAQDTLKVDHLICGNSMRFEKNIIFRPVTRKKELPLFYKILHRLAAFPMILY